MVKNPPAIQETGVRFLSWKDPLEKGTTTHSSVLAWRIPWTEEPAGLQSMESQRVGQDSMLPIQGAWVRSLVSKVEPTHGSKDTTCHS